MKLKIATPGRGADTRIEVNGQDIAPETNIQKICIEFDARDRPYLEIRGPEGTSNNYTARLPLSSLMIEAEVLADVSQFLGK